MNNNKEISLNQILIKSLKAFNIILDDNKSLSITLSKEKIKLKYFELFFCKYSKLAGLGKLSNYSIDEISLFLKKWDRYDKIYNNYRDITWQNRTTLITIRYELLSDKFIKIVNEEWKPNYQKFKRP